ncbi:MAG TPA: sialidase family protein [Chthoniobacterales bacterium]|nr:sialidase family protein [Chthoniobacterales bacterium]
MKSRLHWSGLIISIITVVATGGLFLSNAAARQKRASGRTPAKGAASISAPIYTNGNFTFAGPQELTGHPPSPAFFQADAEPEIIVDVFGNIYVTAIQGVPGGTDFWKSTDKGNSFAYMGQPDGAQDHCNPPVVQCAALGGGDDQIDVSTGGYLYVSSLWLANVTMSASYDGGTGGATPDQQWHVNPAAADIDSDDRQWVAAYGPQTVYMSFATTALTRPPGSVGLFMTKSTDGGKTFPTLVEITALQPLDQVNVESNLVVDPYTGNLYTTYIPNAALNTIKLASSTDGGTTWNITTAYTGPAGTTARGVFPNIALDRGGNLHLIFTQSNASDNTNSHVWLTSSSNPSAASPNWTGAIQVDSGPGNVSACEAWVVAGSPGTVNVAWLGSTAPSPNTVNSNWNVYFAQITNALLTNPTVAQNQVAAGVHNHSICFNGAGCSAGAHGDPGNRDLLEYFRMALDNDGNANIVFADSVHNCDPTTCRTNTWYAKQNGGPSAYNPPAAPASATFAANLIMPNSSGHAEPNMKVDSHNCLFSAAPGGPVAWKSVNNGASFFLLPNPVADETGLVGGDEDILPFAQPNGARPDQLYFADLGVSTVHIRKSTDGGATWFAPGPGGAGGEVSVSSDRQWFSGDRNGADTTIYIWEHEFVSQALRMNALTDDMVWAAPASGMTDPELIAPPGSTLANTVPGPTFVDPLTHKVYGFLSASTVTTNGIGAPTGKLPNVWEGDGAGTFTAGVPPGPFTNHPVFKGVIDSPTTPAPPAGAATVGSNTSNLFNGATIDSAGNIYATWATPNSRNGLYDVWFASSHDHGQTYYGPFKINPTGIQGNMPWITAGDNGRVEIVFYGTNGTEDPTTSTTDQWNVFFAQSLNAGSREPVFTVSQASDHVMHTGPICNVGILCGSNTRQLLDFFQVAIGPDGLANIMYADTGNGNGTSHVSYARQITGPLALNNPSAVTCLPSSIQPVSAVSRKTHGSVGDFDINLPLTGSPGIECRTGGANGNHTVIITFASPVTVGSVSVSSSDNQATVSSSSVNGGVVTVNLANVTNAQTVTVNLTNVSDGTSTGNVGVPMGVLAGDTTANRAVNSSDVAQTQSQSGQAVTAANFREDVTINGEINSSDISFVQAHSGTGLP